MGRKNDKKITYMGALTGCACERMVIQKHQHARILAPLQIEMPLPKKKLITLFNINCLKKIDDTF